MARFHKAVFSPGAIRDFATELIYTARIISFLRCEPDLRDREASDNFVRWVLAGERIYEGRITSHVVDRFAPITKNALHAVLRDIVRRSFAAIDNAVLPTANTPPPEEVAAIGSVADSSAEPSRGKVITTARELDCFATLKKMFEAGKHATSLIFDPSQRTEVPGEFAYKDTTGYLAVYLSKPSWWCVRLVTETRQPWVGFNVPERIGISLMPAGSLRLDPHPYAEFRLALANPEDLLTMAALMDAAIANTLSERRSGGDAFAAHG